MADTVDWDGAGEFFDDVATLISDPKRVVEDAKERDRENPLSASTWMALGKYVSMAGTKQGLLCKTRGIEPQHPRDVYCGLALEVFSLAVAAADASPGLISTAQLRIVDCLGELGRFEEARALVNAHAPQHPDDPEWVLAKAAYAKGEQAELSGLRELHSCLPAYSDEFDRTAANKLVRTLSEGLAKRASIEVTDGNPGNANALMREVLELDPECALAARVMASACWHQEPEDLPGAEKWFARCAELEPENGDNWGYLATVLCEQKRFPQALNAYEQALRCGAGDKEEHVKEKISELRRIVGQPATSKPSENESSGSNNPVSAPVNGPAIASPAPISTPRSKRTAGILGILLGGIGVHRFYLGYNTIGIIQIVVTLVTCGLGGLWGIIEGILVLTGTLNKDAQGNPLVD